jgi:hypothetical protein
MVKLHARNSLSKLLRITTDSSSIAEIFSNLREITEKDLQGWEWGADRKAEKGDRE